MMQAANESHAQDVAAAENQTEQTQENTEQTQENLGSSTETNVDDLTGQDELASTTVESEEGGTSESEESQEGTTNADTDEGVAVPEHLKAHEKLIKAKGWGDFSDQSTQEKILKSYAELQTFAGKKGTDLGLYEQSLETLQTDLTGSIEQINQRREALGVAPINVSDSETHFTEAMATKDLVLRALAGRGNGNQDLEAEQALESYFGKMQGTLNEKAWEKKNGIGGTKGADKVVLKQTAFTNVQNLSRSEGIDREEVLKNLDSLSADPDMGPLLTTMLGVDPLALAQTPERLKILNSVAKRLAGESSFEERVKTEVSKRLKHQQKITSQIVQGNRPQGGGGQTPQKTNQNDLAVAGLFGDGGLTASHMVRS